MARPHRTLIENGHVVSMDAGIGELERGSVLAEGDRIVAVERDLEAIDADVIDARGGVVLPGFVDTHRHTWQTALRAICADWTLLDYMFGMRMTLSPRCTADDVYVGNYVGALEALDSGVTTILDFSHCNNTPEHADKAIEGLVDAGIRALFAYGYFHPPVADPYFTSHEARIDDSRRVARDLDSLSSDLVTMGISLTEPGLIPFDETRDEVETARELGVVMATHTGCVWSLPTGLDQFNAYGLLGPDMVHVHCNACTAREWELLRQSDAKISTSPETEIQMGMGHPPIRRALEAGLRLSLSCDVMSSNSGDMFSQMRMGLQFARCMDNDAFNAERDDPRELSYSVRDALEWATINGAMAIGLDDRIGSLAPGKRADVIVVGPGNDRLNMIAPANPVGAVVTQANPSNVQAVLVAGKAVKRDGRLRGVDFPRIRRMVEESCERILSRVLADGPLLPEPRPSFDDLAAPLMSNFNLAPPLRR
jgi:cytosine/adenosine deaminase-related metal-dependent hydrolase